MSDPERLHQHSQPLRDKILAGLGGAFRSQIAMVKFPIHIEDETTAAGPVPVLGGKILATRDLQAARLAITHHGSGDESNTAVRYRLHTCFGSEMVAQDPIFGNGTFEIAYGSGHFTNANGYTRPLIGYGYRRLGLLLEKVVFTEADTWHAVYDLRLKDKLAASQQIETGVSSQLPGIWRWLNKHFLGPLNEMPPQTWQWY